MASKKRAFRMHQKEFIDLTGRLQIGNIHVSDLEDLLFNDGRMMGIIAEHLLHAEFNNLRMPNSRTAPYDLIILERGVPRYIEVRCLTTKNKHADLVKSSMKGAGRSYDPTGQWDKMKSIDYVIAVDFMDGPLVWARGFPVSQVTSGRNPTTMTRQDWRVSRKTLGAWMP